MLYRIVKIFGSNFCVSCVYSIKIWFVVTHISETWVITPQLFRK